MSMSATAPSNTCARNEMSVTHYATPIFHTTLAKVVELSTFVVDEI